MTSKNGYEMVMQNNPPLGWHISRKGEYGALCGIEFSMESRTYNSRIDDLHNHEVCPDCVAIMEQETGPREIHIDGSIGILGQKLAFLARFDIPHLIVPEKACGEFRVTDYEFGYVELDELNLRLVYDEDNKLITVEYEGYLGI